ncbi:MAG: aldehyde dehydrogenase [Bacteroidetes bacterium]|nr:aldehyde dehydrogenase [Bacteroidota bacterium]
MQKILNYINGELKEPTPAKWVDNYNPATGEVYSLIPDSDERDVQNAVDAGLAAFPLWASTPREERSRIMLRIAELIEQKMDTLTEAESIDNGKPLWLANKVDIPRARDNFKFFATAILHEHSEAYQTDNEAINYSYHTPVGLAGCISPWNLPLYLFTWKIAPAIAAGCCVIAKPSEVTPMTAFMLSEICIEAGLPKGVLNIVHGLGPKVGAAIIEHPMIPAISFTGGTKTGQYIARTAAPMFKKLSLELGGKNPNIIFADCDFEEMMKVTVQSSFSNQGQICLCGSRLFIEESIYEKFKTEFIARVAKLKVGDPNEKETKVGAIVSLQHKEKILSYIQLAKEEGGKILVGGGEVKLDGRCTNGYFISPTLIEGLPHTCRTNQEEIFGPVVTLTPFKNEEEVLMKANSTQYGLAATIWTSDLKRAHRMAHKIHCGIIWINCWLLRDLRTPFGGMKQSGVGREGGFEALRFFTEVKNVCVKL